MTIGTRNCPSGVADSGTTTRPPGSTTARARHPIVTVVPPSVMRRLLGLPCINAPCRFLSVCSDRHAAEYAAGGVSRRCLSHRYFHRLCAGVASPVVYGVQHFDSAMQGERCPGDDDDDDMKQRAATRDEERPPSFDERFRPELHCGPPAELLHCLSADCREQQNARALERAQPEATPWASRGHARAHEAEPRPEPPPRGQLRQARAAARAAGHDPRRLRFKTAAPRAGLGATVLQAAAAAAAAPGRVYEREDTILKPRRASTWRERVAAPLRAAAPAARRQPEAPRLEPAQRRPRRAALEPARRRPVEPARRQPVRTSGQPARLTAAALAAHERQPRAPPAPTGVGRFVAPRAREPPPREPPRPRQALPPIQKLPQGGQDRGPSKRFADRVSAAGKGVASKPGHGLLQTAARVLGQKNTIQVRQVRRALVGAEGRRRKRDPSPAAPPSTTRSTTASCRRSGRTTNGCASRTRRRPCGSATTRTTTGTRTTSSFPGA